MRRAVKVTLKFATEAKRKKIASLMEAYRGAVNFYIRSLWIEKGNLDAPTLARLSNTRLSARYKSQALKQAIDMVVATRKSAKALGVPASCPHFTGSAVLDAKFVTIEEGQGSFDLIVKLSTLQKGQRITIPTKRTAPFNKWANVHGSDLIQGCALSEDGIILWFEIPDAIKPADKGKAMGIDIGVAKLVSDSDGNHYGTEFRSVRDKIRRKKPGSKGRQKACKEREILINKTVKNLPWGSLSVIGVEKLNDMKRGKKKGRGKKFRKAVAPWTYRHVLNQIEQKAAENRVLLVRVDPANTSRTCPSCGAVRKENRSGEKFCCVTCGHTGDADTIGATNILARTLATLGSIESPRPF